MTDLLERTDLSEKTSTGSKEPEFRHFFTKKSIDDFFLLGEPMVALCGFVKTTPPMMEGGQPVCEMCKVLYESIPIEGDE